jgi:PAS domain S-box-containing protein
MIPTPAPLGPGDHVCLLAEDPEEALASLRAYFLPALSARQRILYVSDGPPAEEIRSLLEDLAGNGPDASPDRVRLLSAPDARRLAGLLLDETRAARADGYDGLRAAAEMSFAPGEAELEEVETALGRTLSGAGCILLCRYDAARAPGHLLHRVLLAHPWIWTGGELLRNPYLLPPGISGREGRSGTLLKAWREKVREFHRREEALARSERLVRTLVDSAPDAIFTIDRDGVLLSVNPRAAEYQKLAPEDFPGRNISELLPAELAREALDKVRRVFERTGGPAVLDYEVPTERGPRRFHTILTPIRDADGDVAHAIGVSRDITEVCATEEALRESEEKYRTLVEGSLQGLVMVRGNPPTIVFANPRMAEITGYSLEEMLALAPQDIFKMVSPEDREPFRRQYEDQLRGEGRPRFEFRILRKDGRTRWVESYSRLSTYQGDPVVFAVFVDITDRKMAEENLRESRQLLHKTFASLLDAVIFIDAEEEEIIECNPATTKIFGYGRKDLLGRTSNFLHVDKASQLEFEALVNPAVREKGFLYLPEFPMVRKNGDVFPTEQILIQLEDDAGKRIGWVHMIRDITQRKRSEEERRSLEEQLRHSQKMEAIGTLAGGLAHDFNNLLQGVLGHAEMIRLDLARDDETREAARVIEDAALQASDLTTQLLGFARKGKIQNVPLDVHRVVGEVIALLGRSLDKRVEILTRLRAPFSTVRGDPGQIQQVVMNLAMNASDAMPEGGDLIFETGAVSLDETSLHRHPDAAPGQHLRLSVLDTGTGIPEDIRQRIFEPFFTSKPPGKGTGMGLAMVYGIVENHGGTIDLETREGEGSAFHIHLPLATDEATAPEEGEREGKPPRGKGRVLLLDDEKITREVVERMLRTLGYQVASFEDARRGLEAFRAGHTEIDVVYLDLSPPGMENSDCYAELRKVRPDVKVLVATGHTAGFAMKELIEKGLVQFIKKPFKLAQLAGALEHITGGTPTAT